MSGARRNNPLLAWHASPYDLPEGRFGEMRQVSGKGQGAASYGRGAAYVAENPKVSGPGESEYMKEFRNHAAVGPGGRFWHIFSHDDNQWLPLDDGSFEDSVLPDSMDVSDPEEAGRDWIAHYLSRRRRDKSAISTLTTLLKQKNDDAFAHYMNNDAADIDQEYQPHHATMVRKAMADVDRHFQMGNGNESGPYSYRVALHLSPETLLDWDEAVKDHHPEVREKIVQAFEDPISGEAWRDAPQSGSSVYRQLTYAHGSDFAATEALLKAGIHGIRYKDAGSRGYQPAAVLLDGKDIGRDHPVQAPVSEKQYLDMLRTLMEGTGLRDLQEAADQVKKHAENWFANPGNAVQDHIYQSYANAAQWYNDNKHRVELRAVRPTYNYVVFHPDLLETLEQYNIKGEKTKDYGPGVHLKAVEHDPFEGEDR